MTRTPIMRFFPVSIVGLLICYAVTCHAQIPISREDEETIKKVIAGTTEAFNKHDEKAFAAFMPRSPNLRANILTLGWTVRAQFLTNKMS